MKCWVLNATEILEIEDPKAKLLRSSLVASELVRDHDVTFWASSVGHIHRKQRVERSERVLGSSGIHYQFIKAPLYKKNISIKRLWHNIALAVKFYLRCRRESPPDVIFCAFPPIEFGFAAALYAKKNSVPLAIDIRDYWPDIFYPKVFPALRWLATPYLAWLNFQVRYQIRVAASVTGISRETMRWASEKSRIDVAQKFRLFPHAYKKIDSLGGRTDILQHLKLDPLKHKIFCFSGTLSNRYELDLVARVAEALWYDREKDIRIVLCGRGEAATRLRSLSEKIPTLVMPGFINKFELAEVMQSSTAGLLPYPSTPDFKISYPTKVSEYIGEGLPIISSLSGITEDLLKEYNCGITYNNNDFDGLHDAIITAARDEDLMEIQSANAKALFPKMFDADTVYTEFKRHIESLVMAK